MGDASQSIRLLERSERSIRGPSYHRTLDPTDASEATKNRLGTFFGVYIPTVLGIFGVVIFLRLSWITGQAGLFLFHYLGGKKTVVMLLFLKCLFSCLLVGLINTYLMYVIAGSVAGLTGMYIYQSR